MFDGPKGGPQAPYEGVQDPVFSRSVPPTRRLKVMDVIEGAANRFLSAVEVAGPQGVPDLTKVTGFLNREGIIYNLSDVVHVMVNIVLQELRSEPTEHVESAIQTLLELYKVTAITHMKFRHTVPEIAL